MAYRPSASGIYTTHTVQRSKRGHALESFVVARVPLHGTKIIGGSGEEGFSTSSAGLRPIG